MKKLLIALLTVALAACSDNALDTASQVAPPEQSPSAFDSLKATLSDNSEALPILNLTVDSARLNSTEYIAATLEIADRERRTDGNFSTTFACRVKYRGTSALAYDKKSFSVKLIDAEGEELDANILGLRNDDTWILDAMAIDRLRMRNRLNFDLWNSFSATPYATNYEQRNGTVGLFAELFINGYYHGLYCLSDKVNRKLLGLKKVEEEDGSPHIRGVLYKCVRWGTGAGLNGYAKQDMTQAEWNTWELKYPDDYPCEAAYAPLKELIDFCTITGSSTFMADIDKHFYIDNLTDYQVFLLATGLRDNCLKNTFLSVVNIDEDRRFLLTPWDLDCSLGGNYNGDHWEELAENYAINAYPFRRLWQLSSAYCDKVRERWQTLSNCVLAEEAFNRRVDDYVARITKSGAWARERQRWNNNPVPLADSLGTEADYVKEWYRANAQNIRNNVLR